MIYIKRFIWALGCVPMFILGIILGFINMVLFPFIGLFYYVKNGDVETTPDKYMPLHLAIQLEDAYRKLEPKPRKED